MMATEQSLRERIDYLEAENAEMRSLLRLDPSVEFISKAKNSLQIMPQVARLLWVVWDCKCKTKAAIYHALWGDLLNPPDIKGIDVQMCRLRAAIASYGAKIDTVWGHGFQLQPEDREKIAAAMGLGVRP